MGPDVDACQGLLLFQTSLISGVDGSSVAHDCHESVRCPFMWKIFGLMLGGSAG